MTSKAPQLDPGEVLLWSDKPKAMWLALRKARQPLLLAILFLFFSLTLFAEHGRLPPLPADPKSFPPAMFVRTVQLMAGAFGLIALLAGLWFCFRACRTSYQLTNRRVVIETASPVRRRVSIPLEHLRYIELRSKWLGPSDIVFSEARNFSLEGWGPRGEGFMAIADAERVEGLVRAAIEQTFSTRTRGPWQ
jgi:hypothetical protein